MSLKSFGTNLNVAVFGAKGGLGASFVRAFHEDPAVARVYAASRSGEVQDGVISLVCDPLQESDLCATAARIAESGPLHLCIVAIGVLHDGAIQPEKSWRQIDSEAMAYSMRVNAIAPAMIAKHMLPLLSKDGKSCFAVLSARVGSIADNLLGGWVSYRASKAALNMVVRTLSIELARQNNHAIVLGLHPGTVDTRLSEPFQTNVADGQLLTPDESTAKLLQVLDAATNIDSGSVISYAGERIPA